MAEFGPVQAIVVQAVMNPAAIRCTDVTAGSRDPLQPRACRAPAPQQAICAAGRVATRNSSYTWPG